VPKTGVAAEAVDNGVALARAIGFRLRLAGNRHCRRPWLRAPQGLPAGEEGLPPEARLRHVMTVTKKRFRVGDVSNCSSVQSQGRGHTAAPAGKLLFFFTAAPNGRLRHSCEPEKASGVAPYR
jgi:hypothetical protein